MTRSTKSPTIDLCSAKAHHLGLVIAVQGRRRAEQRCSILGHPLPGRVADLGTGTLPGLAASRYLYAPSSIPLKKGQGYVSQKRVFTSEAYALNDDLTVLVAAFIFFPPALSVFGVKAGVQIRDGLHLSAGGEAFVFGLDPEIATDIGFGAATFGAGSDLADGQGLNSTTNGVGSAALSIMGRRDPATGVPRGLRTASGHSRTTWDNGLIGVGFRGQITFSDEVAGEEVLTEFYSWDVFAPIPWVDWTWHFESAGN